jgi:hypothetical protein
VQAGVETEGTFFKSAHFLKAKGHVVHGNLDEEAVLGISLELKSVKERLRLL